MDVFARHNFWVMAGHVHISCRSSKAMLYNKGIKQRALSALGFICCSADAYFQPTL